MLGTSSPHPLYLSCPPPPPQRASESLELLLSNFVGRPTGGAAYGAYVPPCRHPASFIPFLILFQHPVAPLSFYTYLSWLSPSCYCVSLLVDRVFSRCLATFRGCRQCRSPSTHSLISSSSAGFALPRIRLCASLFHRSLLGLSLTQIFTLSTNACDHPRAPVP